MLGELRHHTAAEFERINAGRPRNFFDEALHVEAVLVGVDTAPGADRHMRVAHRILDQQVRYCIAELRVTGLGIPALQLAVILVAAGDCRRIDPGVD